MGFSTIIDGEILHLSFPSSTTFWTYFFWIIW